KLADIDLVLWVPCAVAATGARDAVKAHVARVVAHPLPFTLVPDEQKVLDDIRRAYNYYQHMEQRASQAMVVPDWLVDRFAVPGMIEGKVLRSPYAHARIVSIDTSKAARHPGVLAVLTGADLTDIDPYFGQAVRDQPVLAIERVRFAGEPVVAVAAVDALSAEAALRHVSVEYAPLPVIRTIDEALAPGASQLQVDRPRSTLFPDV